MADEVAESNSRRLRKIDPCRVLLGNGSTLHTWYVALVGFCCICFTNAASSRDVIIRMDGPAAPREIARAIGRLVENKSVLLGPITLEDARAPFQAIVRQLKWPVEIDRPEFDNLLCQRNRNICCVSGSLNPRGAQETCSKHLATPRKTESGFPEDVWLYCDKYPPRCTYRWTVQQRRNNAKYGFECAGNRSPRPWLLCVPVVDIAAFWTVQVFPFSRRQSLQDIAIRAVNCNLRSKWRMERLSECRSRFNVGALDKLNAGDYKRYAELFGRLNAPVLGYSVSVRVPNAVTSDLARFTVAALNEQIAKKMGASAAVLSAIDSANVTEEFLIPQGSVSPKGSVASRTSTTNLDREDESRHTLISMGFAQTSVDSAADIPSMVVLEDGVVPYKHVELLELKAVSSKAIVAAIKAGTECPKDAKDVYSTQGEARAANFLNLNHAAGVLGVIGASLNHLAALGVFQAAHASPARVWLFKPDATDFQSSVPLKAFQEKCDGRVNMPLIVNLSGLTIEADAREALRRTLIGDHGESATRLFVVVAAGNTNEFPRQAGKALPPDCTIYPSCVAFRTEHMVSVVGLNKEGNGIDTASLKGLAFEVAAISQVSALSADSHADMVDGNGSSFAVPYVSSLSALISARFFSGLQGSRTSLLPSDLKKRILATVDFQPKLDGSVAFGRINFSRALDLEDDKIEIATSNDACDSSQSSVVHGIPTKNSYIEISGFDAVQGVHEQGREFNIKDVMRISRVCGNSTGNPGRFNVIVYAAVHEGTPLKTPQIIRYRNATLKAYKLDETLSNGRTISISPSSLRDYTACLRPVWKPDCRVSSKAAR